MTMDEELYKAFGIRYLRWWITGAGLLLFAVLFFIPARLPSADPAPSRLAFSGTTTESLKDVSRCLGQNRGGHLTLRHRRSPAGGQPGVRLDNPVRHFVVEVVDTGQERLLRAYTRSGAPFSPRETDALRACLAGSRRG